MQVMEQAQAQETVQVLETEIDPLQCLWARNYHGDLTSWRDAEAGLSPIPK